MSWLKYAFIVILAVVYTLGWRFIIIDLRKMIRRDATFDKKNEHYFRIFFYCWVAVHITGLILVGLVLLVFR